MLEKAREEVRLCFKDSVSLAATEAGVSHSRKAQKGGEAMSLEDLRMSLVLLIGQGRQGRVLCAGLSSNFLLL